MTYDYDDDGAGCELFASPKNDLLCKSRALCMNWVQYSGLMCNCSPNSVFKEEDKKRRTLREQSDFKAIATDEEDKKRRTS